MEIRYDTEEKVLTPKRSENLLELCLENKVPISHSCEGMASCGTCCVLITSDTNTLPPRNELEQEMANDRNFRDEERLACQLELNSSFSFKLPG